MSSRQSNTNRTFLTVALLLITGGLLLASKSGLKTSTDTATSGSTASDTTATTTPIADSARWDGDLIVLQGNSIVAYAQSGAQRTVYTAPTGATITKVTPVTGSEVSVELSQGSPKVLTVNLGSGTTANRSDISSLTGTSPRPTTNSVASVSFSNAERNFGSTVTLRDGSGSKTLYQTKDAITDLVWNNDGSTLAIGTQTGVAIATANDGTAKDFPLTSPAKSLRWSSSVLYITTAAGTVATIDTAMPLSVATLATKNLGSVNRDFMAIGNNRFAWLSNAGIDSPVVVTTQNLSEYDTHPLAPKQAATAAEILGVFHGK